MGQQHLSFRSLPFLFADIDRAVKVLSLNVDHNEQRETHKKGINLWILKILSATMRKPTAARRPSFSVPSSITIHADCCQRTFFQTSTRLIPTRTVRSKTSMAGSFWKISIVWSCSMGTLNGVSKKCWKNIMAFDELQIRYSCVKCFGLKSRALCTVTQ